jgi:hypothetical protein
MSQKTLDDLLVTRQLLLLRYANSEFKTVFDQYFDLSNKISTILRNSEELSNSRKSYINSKINELQRLVDFISPNLIDIALLEYHAVKANIEEDNSVIPVPIGDIKEIGKYAFVGGAMLADWFTKANNDAKFAIAETVKRLANQNATNIEIAKGLTGSTNNIKGGEPLKRTLRGIDADIKTAVLGVATNVRERIMQENIGLFSLVMHNSIIDTKTTDICLSRNGKLWEYPSLLPYGHQVAFKTPPLHRNCRSYISYIYKGNEDKYLNTERNFNKWLSQQDKSFLDKLLGKGKAELYLSGKITLNELVDNKNNPISLKVLKQQYS